MMSLTSNWMWKWKLIFPSELSSFDLTSLNNLINWTSFDEIFSHRFGHLTNLRFVQLSEYLAHNKMFIPFLNEILTSMHIINNAQVSISADLWFITGAEWKMWQRLLLLLLLLALWWIMVDADINMRLESISISNSSEGADVRFYKAS